MNRTFSIAAWLAAISFYVPVAGAASLYGTASTFKLDGMSPHSAVIADFNVDGTDDLAAVFPIIDKLSGAITGSRLNFLVGNADGNLKIETTESLPFDVRSMATGDFDGDGQPDLAVAQKLPAGGSAECGVSEGTVIYFGFHKEVQPVISYAGCVTSVPAADLTTLDANGDGLDDLVIGDELLLGNGDGSFTPSATLPTGDKNVADINGDGVLDVMTSTEAVCGIGDGTYTPCQAIANDVLVDTDANGQIVTINYSLYGGGTRALSDATLKIPKQPTADLDGNGNDDFVGWAVISLKTPIITYWRSCSWRLTTVRSFHKRARSGRGSGYYRSRRMWLYSCSTSNTERVGWEKISYTSNKIVPGTSALRVSLVLADGSVEQITGPSVDGVFRAIQLTDTDEDGNVDVLASIGQANNEGHIENHPDYPSWTLFPGNGDGTFGAPVDSGLALDYAMPGDWNGDGLMDFGRYITPIDSEHLLSVVFHAPPTGVTSPPEPAPAPPAPAVDTTPPSVAITAPSAADSVSGQVIISATVSDDTAVAEVVFKYNETTIGQATSPPYQVSWDTGGLMTGAYTLKAVAADSAGNRATAKITVTVNATAPAPEPTPEPTPSSTQPTGQTIEFEGVVTEVGNGYFVAGGIRVNYNATSIMKYNGSQSTPTVGDPVQGKADEYSDGTALAIKAEFG